MSSTLSSTGAVQSITNFTPDFFALGAYGGGKCVHRARRKENVSNCSDFTVNEMHETGQVVKEP